MVLIQLLGVCFAAVELRNKVLRNAHDSLQGRQDVCDQAKDGVRRLEVCSVVADLVVLDHDQSGDGCQERNIVEGCVSVGAFFLLLCGVCGLDHEDALDEEEERGGVEEL